MSSQLAEAPAAFQHRRRDALRVLIASHAHPRISKGGAQIAAFSLFRQLQSAADCEAWFLGCHRDRRDAPARIGQPFTEREFVYTPANLETFTCANRDRRFPGEFEQLMRELLPDIVHFHHYANFGVEVFHIAKRALPDVRVVLTLREYLAMCAHHGRMVTKQHRHLCHRADPAECSRCFPERDPSDFYVRNSYIRRFFDEVDHLVAPTRFLQQRYVEWGLAEDKFTCIPDVVEQPLDDGEAANDGVFRVGFFGQPSPLKGIDVLIAAARRLEAAGRRDIAIEVHGDCRDLPAELQTAFTEQLTAAPANLRYLGPYDETRVDRLMRRVDVVAVPSICWENRPLVIQEALRNRRPVVCSDIGGMAETVRDGIDGFHFPVGDAALLADLLARLAAAPDRLAAMRPALATPPPPEAVAQQHIALYRRLLA